MRAVFSTTAVPLRTAKSLSRELKDLGIEPALGHCREAVAEMFGYSDWHELERNCRPPQESLPPVEPGKCAEIVSRRFRIPTTAAAKAVEKMIRSRSVLPDVGHRDQRFGVILFDDATPGPGWTAAGCGPARRIDGPHQISTEVIWWTNTGEEEFYHGEHGIWRNPWLRHGGYLTVDQRDLAVRLAAGPAPARQTEVLAAAFGAIMTASFALALVLRPGIRRENFFAGAGLHADLSKTMLESGWSADESTLFEPAREIPDGSPEGTAWLVPGRRHVAAEMRLEIEKIFGFLKDGKIGVDEFVKYLESEAKTSPFGRPFLHTPNTGKIRSRSGPSEMR